MGCAASTHQAQPKPCCACCACCTCCACCITPPSKAVLYDDEADDDGMHVMLPVPSSGTASGTRAVIIHKAAQAAPLPPPDEEGTAVVPTAALPDSLARLKLELPCLTLATASSAAAGATNSTGGSATPPAEAAAAGASGGVQAMAPVPEANPTGAAAAPDTPPRAPVPPMGAMSAPGPLPLPCVPSGLPAFPGIAACLSGGGMLQMSSRRLRALRAHLSAKGFLMDGGLAQQQAAGSHIGGAGAGGSTQPRAASLTPPAAPSSASAPAAAGLRSRPASRTASLAAAATAHHLPPPGRGASGDAAAALSALRARSGSGALSGGVAALSPDAAGADATSWGALHRTSDWSWSGLADACSQPAGSWTASLYGGSDDDDAEGRRGGAGDGDDYDADPEVMSAAAAAAAAMEAGAAAPPPASSVRASWQRSVHQAQEDVAVDDLAHGLGHGGAGVEHPAVTAFKAGTLGWAFSGGGFFFPYHLGVVIQLKDMGILTPATPLAGASCGSIITACVNAGLDLHALVDRLLEFAADCRQYGTAGRLRSVILKFMAANLPADAAARCSGRCFISVTRVFPYMHPCVLDHYTSKEDLVTAIATSCHIPAYNDGSFLARFRDSWCVDGGLVRHIPLLPPSSGATYTAGVSCVPFKFLEALPGVSRLQLLHSLQISPDMFGTFPFGWSEVGGLVLAPAEDDVLLQMVEMGKRDVVCWSAAVGLTPHLCSAVSPHRSPGPPGAEEPLLPPAASLTGSSDGVGLASARESWVVGDALGGAPTTPPTSPQGAATVSKPKAQARHPAHATHAATRLNRMTGPECLSVQVEGSSPRGTSPPAAGEAHTAKPRSPFEAASQQALRVLVDGVVPPPERHHHMPSVHEEQEDEQEEEEEEKDKEVMTGGSRLASSSAHVLHGWASDEPSDWHDAVEQQSCAGLHEALAAAQPHREEHGGGGSPEVAVSDGLAAAMEAVHGPLHMDLQQAVGLLGGSGVLGLAALSTAGPNSHAAAAAPPSAGRLAQQHAATVRVIGAHGMTCSLRGSPGGAGGGLEQDGGSDGCVLDVHLLPVAGVQGAGEGEGGDVQRSLQLMVSGAGLLGPLHLTLQLHAGPQG